MVADYCRILTGSEFSSTFLPNVLGSNWLNIIFLGLLGTALLMAFVYMISKAMRIPRLEGWSRHEMFQIIGTAVLAIMATGMIYSMCTFNISFLSYDLYGGDNGKDVMEYCVPGGVDSAGLSGPSNPNGMPIITPFCAAQAYLKKVDARGKTLFLAMIGVNSIMTQLFRITYESRPLGIGYTLEPLAGLQQIQNVFLVAVSGFMISYLSLLVQMRILDYMVVSIPFFFMPLGILLRCFVPTREFGGAILGFCFSSLLFFPLLLVMNDVIIFSSLDEFAKQADGINKQLYPTTLDANGQVTSIFNATEAGEAINLHWGMYNEDPSANGEWVQRTTNSNSQTPVTYFTDPDPSAPDEQLTLASKQLTTIMLWPMTVVVVYSIAAVLMPIINFLIYIEIARGLSKMLGSEMDLSNLTRMI